MLHVTYSISIAVTIHWHLHIDYESRLGGFTRLYTWSLHVDPTSDETIGTSPTERLSGYSGTCVSLYVPSSVPAYQPPLSLKRVLPHLAHQCSEPPPGTGGREVLHILYPTPYLDRYRGRHPGTRQPSAPDEGDRTFNLSRVPYTKHSTPTAPRLAWSTMVSIARWMGSTGTASQRNERPARLGIDLLAWLVDSTDRA